MKFNSSFRFTPSSWKDIGNRKFQFVVKLKFLSQLFSIFCPLYNDWCILCVEWILNGLVQNHLISLLNQTIQAAGTCTLYIYFINTPPSSFPHPSLFYSSSIHIHLSSIHHPFLIHLSSNPHPFFIHPSLIPLPSLIHSSSMPYPFLIHPSTIPHPSLIHPSSIPHPFLINSSSIPHPSLIRTISNPSLIHSSFIPHPFLSYTSSLPNSSLIDSSLHYLLAVLKMGYVFLQTFQWFWFCLIKYL